MPTPRSLICALVPLLLLLAAIRPVRADEEEARASAQAIHRRARLAYDTGNYREALARFEEAYLKLPDPSFLVNIAQCHRKLGDRERAVQSLRSYLRAAEGDPRRADTVAQVRRLLETMETAEPPAHPAPPAPAPTPVVAPPALSTTAVAPAPPRRTRWWIPVVATIGVIGVSLAIALPVAWPSIERSRARDVPLGTQTF